MVNASSRDSIAASCLRSFMARGVNLERRDLGSKSWSLKSYLNGFQQSGAPRAA